MGYKSLQFLKFVKHIVKKSGDIRWGPVSGAIHDVACFRDCIVQMTHSDNPMTWLVTGNAGFIGFHLANRLLQQGHIVVGFDVVNDYYDGELKESRLQELDKTAKHSDGEYRFYRENLADLDAVNRCFANHTFDRVINLAAQAGVRYSLTNPHSYVESNVVGFTNLLEACRHHHCPHLVYASSSSVYGGNTNLPSSVHTTADHPLQFYAATKRANELMAHAYSHLYRLPVTGLRFFTVYGPWGRPDMAPFKFVKNILEGNAIDLYNHGDHSRDFTYIDDIVESIIRVADHIPEPDPDWDPSNPGLATSNAPYRLLNIGNNSPVELRDYIAAIEAAIGHKAKVNSLPMQPGDIHSTFADTDDLVSLIDFKPKTSIMDGVAELVAWYKKHYDIQS